VLAIIVVAKGLAAYGILRALRQPIEAALTVAPGRAQVGEFSFIFMALAVSLQVIPELGRDLLVAGAVGSILVNPFAFSLADRLRHRFAPPAAAPEPEALTHTTLTGHVVLVGYGRVGSLIGDAARARGETLLVIEYAEPILERLRAEGTEVLPGAAQTEDLIEAVNIGQAKILIVAIPNSFEAGQYVEQARRRNATIPIVARAHSEAEVEYLGHLGASQTILGETEIAAAMIARAFG
jgi:CPA2 family monovalent cation:H+ antiporter-2